MPSETLPPAVGRFIMHFGEMGSRWGINRTVGQMYALLYLAEKPLCADEIAGALGFSRSNVSMGLKELDGMRLIRMVHLPGDRREHFAAPDDIWDIVRTLVEERRKREIEPTLSILRDLLLEADPQVKAQGHARARMQEMYDLLSLLTDWYNEVRDIEVKRLVMLLKTGRKVFKLLELGDKVGSTLTGRKAKS